MSKKRRILLQEQVLITTYNIRAKYHPLTLISSTNDGVHGFIAGIIIE
jgi:hypothetical protein